MKFFVPKNFYTFFSKLTYFEIQGLNRKFDYGKRAEYYVARLVSSIFKEADNPKRQKLIGELVKTDGGIMGAEKTLDKISEDGWRKK